MKYITLVFATILVTSPLCAKEWGLKQGAMAPVIKTVDINGNSFDTMALRKKGPVVLVFYRGGWCPYCNIQLRKLEKEVVPHLAKYGATMAAISVDKVDEGLKTKKAESLSFHIISDPDMEIIEDYNIKFKVPESLVSKYKTEYKLDLEAASGRKHHTIAVPAVYVIDRKGKIAFAYANEDYKVRAQEKDILSSLKSLNSKTNH